MGTDVYCIEIKTHFSILRSEDKVINNRHRYGLV